MNSLKKQRYRTTWGIIEVRSTDGKVTRCTLPILDGQPKIPFAVEPGGSDEVSKFIGAVFQGLETRIPALGTLEGTDFQRQVWQAIAAIPTGETRTYGELAQMIGRPNAVRAVGSACGKNPVPLFIPCHRVVAAHGGVGGFTAGLPWKSLLLAAAKTPIR